MRRTFACILMIIYSCFTAGAALQAPAGEGSDPISIQSFYGQNINASEKDAGNCSSHINVVNFHKLHKHLAASRTLKVPGINFPAIASPIYSCTTIVNDAKKAKIAEMPEISHAGIFIKNRVLRI